MSATAILEYKCRRCGRIADGARTSWNNALRFVVDIESGRLPPGIPQTMYDVHDCSDDGLGVCDFIGMRKADELSTHRAPFAPLRGASEEART